MRKLLVARRSRSMRARMDTYSKSLAVTLWKTAASAVESFRPFH